MNLIFVLEENVENGKRNFSSQRLSIYYRYARINRGTIIFAPFRNILFDVNTGINKILMNDVSIFFHTELRDKRKYSLFFYDVQLELETLVMILYTDYLTKVRHKSVRHNKNYQIISTINRLSTESDRNKIVFKLDTRIAHKPLTVKNNLLRSKTSYLNRVCKKPSKNLFYSSYLILSMIEGIDSS